MSKFQFFRAISENELADLKATGSFNIRLGGFEAKQFVLALEDAIFFKNRFPYIDKSKINYIIVKILLEHDYYEKLISNPDSKMWMDDRWVITIKEDDLEEFNRSVSQWEIID